jgi:hypothetical protein
MTINFYIDEIYIGCGSYDNGIIYETSCELDDAVVEKIEYLLGEGEDFGFADNVYFEVRK